MRKILLLAALLGGFVQAEPYPQQDLASLVSPKAFHFDRAIALVKALQPLAGQYPTRFDSDADRQRARADIRALSGLLELVRDDNIIGPDQPERLTLLWLLAKLGVYGHNLDMEGGFQRANDNFAAALQLVPATEKRQRAALLADYGRFLTSATREKQGEKYLREAVQLNPQLAFALAENLVVQGKKKEALAVLADYLKLQPDDADAQRLQRALKGEGDLKLSVETAPFSPSVK